MLLDLNDPKSIVAWWEVFPERHGPLLADWAQRRPEVRGAIALASQMIRANPRTAVMLREAELRRAANEVAQVPPSHDEQLAREEGVLQADDFAGQDERDPRDAWDTWDAQEDESVQELDAVAC
ncbi:hypothetical protein [Roseateles depolymerans]|uniref:Uncharacterized protein n=1 Tax=Roseateles depolymerans TaxID=76731 RepID=A0A0U3LF80_9BURK|nr:hypothetical protein [Roseateles depolymerans]ALV06719.1 hypothetical protein RD2015_2247 [Roseateles depolymerans]REG19696.1 hypothetical protein DES44_2196 [Roseateles depolymerans]